MEVSGKSTPLRTARQAGLVACQHCYLVHETDVVRCQRCGGKLASRMPGSLQRVWAWFIAGLIVYVPANVYPMLITDTIGQHQENTIVGGAVELFNHGSYGIAAVVFVASVMIPISKFIAIGYLALGVRSTVAMHPHRRHQLYEIVEFIGRWSMIDVFVVAILAALVQLGNVAIVHPGIAAVSFALSVAFTMLSAQSLDPRLIWDADEEIR